MAAEHAKAANIIFGLLHTKEIRPKANIPSIRCTEYSETFLISGNCDDNITIAVPTINMMDIALCMILSLSCFVITNRGTSL